MRGDTGDTVVMTCPCPVHKNPPVPEYPLGIRIAGKVSIECINRHVARDIYVAHHSYMPDCPGTNITHHGIQLDGKLVGSITYRHPLMPGIGDVNGGDIVEVARICVVSDTPNLASCAFGRSQERFIREEASKRGIKLLVTFVKADYEGSMVRALRHKGWVNDGVSEGKQATNREEKEIHDSDKVRWVRQLESGTEQTELTEIIK